MPIFRKKPVTIEAVQYNGFEYVDDVRTPMFDLSFHGPDWLIEAQGKPEREAGAVHLDDIGRLAIVTLEGTMFASPNDYVIRGVQGEIYPCKPDIFAATYDQIEDTTAKRGAKEQVAFDSGAGHRAITHDRTNPYCPDVTPGQHAAWEQGWEKTDRELAEHTA